MEDTEEEEFLNLSLAIVASDSCGDHKQKKRKRSITRVSFNSLNNNPYHHEEAFVSEGKIFKLLQMREQMLKLDHHKKKVVVENGKGLHLIHMLLITATSIDQNNISLALENLTELYQTVSLTGDSVQRVVAHFSDGLAARLLTRRSPFYDMIMKHPTDEEQFLAFTELYRVSPYFQFGHFTANQAILEAFEEEMQSNNKALHVIDFDVSYGFQWPSLMQSLSEKATNGNRISLRISGFGRSIEDLQETENRLVSFSKSFRNLVFEFQGLIRGSKLVNIRRKKNETVAVNLVFYLNTLNSCLKIPETLNLVRDSIKPSIAILVEQEGSRRSPRNFLSRFMESLQYYAAMFDSLDDCLPQKSNERLSIEKNHLGKEIKSMLNCDKLLDDGNYNNNYPRYERMETWKERMKSHGFEGIKMSSKSLIQAKLLLKIRTHYCPLQFDGENNNGFKVFERDDGEAISLGWQDRCLLTASAWHCV